MPREVSPQRLYDAVEAHDKVSQLFRRATMRLVDHTNDFDKLILVESPSMFITDMAIGVSDLAERLSDPDFDGILWDNRGLKRVLTRDILQEGLDTYRMTHLQPRAPFAPHVGVFLWEQAISREEADQRSQARTSDSTGSENESDQNPLET